MKWQVKSPVRCSIANMEQTEEELGPPNHWVTVERFRDLSAAIVARSALEATEIPCFLRDENTVRMDWQISNFIGGMRLQVREQDLKPASAVLAGLAIDELPDELRKLMDRPNTNLRSEQSGTGPKSSHAERIRASHGASSAYASVGVALLSTTREYNAFAGSKSAALSREKFSATRYRSSPSTRV